MIAADLVRAVTLLVLAALVLAGAASLTLLLAAVLVAGVAQCFFDSATQALIPTIVGRDKDALAHANGRYWALDTAGRSMLGPPLGSFTFALARFVPFAVDGLSFIVSAVLIRLLPAVPAQKGSHQRIGSAIRMGLRHLGENRGLLVLALGLSAFNGAFNIAMAPFVLYATDVLDVPVAAYGLLLATTAVGGIVAGWQARWLTERLSYRQTVSLTVLAQATVWGGIVLTANVWVTGVLFAVQGAAASLTSVAVGSARQAMTPDELLGRVVSVFRLLGIGSAGIGALIGGGLAHAFGLNTPMIAAAAILLLSAMALWPFTAR